MDICLLAWSGLVLWALQEGVAKWKVWNNHRLSMSPIWPCSPSMINVRLTRAGWIYLQHTVNQVNLVTQSVPSQEKSEDSCLQALSWFWRPHLIIETLVRIKCMLGELNTSRRSTSWQPGPSVFMIKLEYYTHLTINGLGVCMCLEVSYLSECLSQRSF